MAEVIIGDQRPVGLAAKLTKFLFIDLLEYGTLVPARARKQLHIAIKFSLSNIEDADLQGGVSLRIVDKIMETPPSALQLLEFRRMENCIQLRRILFIKACDHLLDCVNHVAFD